MDILFKTAFLGIFVFFVWKLCNILLNYIQLCLKLRQFPQKPSHWLFGHAKEVTDSATYFKYAFDVMKEGNKSFCIWNGPFPLVGVCHPETFQQLNKQALNKSRGFGGPYRLLEPWLGEGLLISGSIKNKLSEASKNGKPVDVCPYVCRATLDNMLRCSLSYDGSMQENEEHNYVKAVQKLSNIAWHRMTSPPLLFDTIFNFSPTGRQHNNLLDVVHKFTGDIIAKRQKLLVKQPDLTRQKRRLDFLDILLTAKHELGNGLSVQEIQDEVDTFTFEGHDTTVSAISYAIYALGQFPELQEKVFDPSRFDTERRDSNEIYGFIPFSAGSRNCIGQVFANNEIKIVIAKLVKRYQVLPIKDHKPKLQPDLVMRSSTGLHVILQKRQG